MAKVQIKTEKITPFGGIFHVRKLFSRYVDPIIDKVLGLQCTLYKNICQAALSNSKHILPLSDGKLYISLHPIRQNTVKPTKQPI